MDDNLDILVNLLLNQQAKAKTDQGLKETAKNIENMGDAFPVDELNADFAKFQAAFSKTFKSVNGELIDTRTGLKTTTGELRKFSGTTTEALDKIIKKEDELVDKNKEVARSAADSAAAQAAIFSAQASILNNQVTQIRARSSQLTRLSSGISQASQLGLATGIGITAGIFGFADKYVKNAEEATRVTIAWKKAQDSLAESGNRIGAVFAEAALPVLQKAAEAAEKAAGFIEKHPELVQAALNVGIITAGISAIGLAVSKGIKLYADYLYLSSVPIQLQAAQLQFAASEQQLTAAVLRGEAKGLTAFTEAGPNASTAGGSVAAAATSVGLVIAGIIAAKYAVDLVNIVLERTGIAKNIADAQQKILETSKRPYPGIITAARPKADGSGGEAVPVEATGVQASEAFQQILSAYEKYRQDDLQAVQDHYRARQQVIQDSLNDEQRAVQQFQQAISRVRSQAGSAISQATKQFNQENARAEQDNAQARAQIVRDGGVEIQRIEQGLQERLRKLAADHGERMDDLARSRDALGLVKEQRRYNQERGEEVRQTNLEIRQRRQDLAIRLADLQQSYENERAQRLADFQARVLEIRQNAAAEIAELRTQHQRELQEIRQNRIAKLRELDSEFADEQKRRRQQFIAQVRDLDASLLGEQNLKKSYYTKMTADLDKFLASYRSKMGSVGRGGQAPGFQTGGYASYGTYVLGDAAGGGRGKREFVMSGDTTQIAERLLGGNLTQQRMIAALQFAGGARQSAVNYTDNRRIDSKMGPVERRQIADDVITQVEDLLRSSLPARGR